MPGDGMSDDPLLTKSLLWIEVPLRGAARGKEPHLPIGIAFAGGTRAGRSGPAEASPARQGVLP